MIDDEEYKILRELDIQIATHIFKYNVLGWLPAMHPDGSWTIHPDSDVETGICSLQPVYLARCMCEFYEEEYDVKVFNHINSCMEVLPHYSSRIEDAWQVLDYLSIEQLDLIYGDLKNIICYNTEAAAETICRVILRRL